MFKVKFEAVLLMTLILIFGVFFVLSVDAKPVTYDWDMPTEREDGSVLKASEIKAYRIYEDGAFVVEVEGDQTSTIVDTGAAGDICASISTVDTDDQEGLQSEIHCYRIVPPAPKAPSGFGSSL